MTRLLISLTIIGCMFAHPSNAEVDPESIVAAWLFDETSGKTAKDTSENGNNGIVVGGAKWVKGKFDNAIELNGQDAWVTVPEIGPLDEFTLTKWFNLTGRVGRWRCFFNRDGWAPGFVHYQFRPDNKMEMAIHSNNPGNHPGAFGSSLTADENILNEWIHLAVAYSRIDESVRVYFDGELDVEDKWGPWAGEFGPGRIGSWDGGGREWEGLFDEMLLFDVALEQSDIQTLMDNGLLGTVAVEPTDKLATNWGEIKLGRTQNR